MTRLHHILVAALALLLMPLEGDAHGKRRKKKNKAKDAVSDPVRSSIRLELIDRSVLDLPFGGDLPQVMKWVGKRLDVVNGPRLKAALDSRERDRIKAELRDSMRDIERGVVAFEGRRSGYEGSIVAGEFEDGVGDSLLLFREGGIQHYLFFYEGKLYRYARPVSGEGSFKEAAQRYEGEHGPPHEKSARPPELLWRGLTFDLRLKDRRLLFAADLLTLEVTKLAKARAKAIAKKATNKGDGGGGALEDFIDRGESTEDEK